MTMTMEIRVFDFVRSRTVRLALLAATLLLFASLPSLARVQETGHPPPPGTTMTPPSPPSNSSGAGDAVSVNPEGGETKLPIENVAPYNTWKHHTAGKAEEALVRVRYTPDGGGPETRTTGLVIRCDGFILVPRPIRDSVREGGTLSVTLTDIDGREKAKGPLEVAARTHPRSSAAVPYALIKTNNYHVRSLPLLAGGNVAPGTPVRVLWFGPGTDAIQARKAVVGSVVGSPSQARNRDRETFSLAPATADAAPIPLGAIVVDTESGAAVGMVTEVSEGGVAPTFITFGRFHVIAGEVGLAPDRSAVRLGDRSGSLPQGSPPMVFVPGGPAALDGKAGGDFQRDYGTTVACTPGFWMAVQPVTNGEYAHWLQGNSRPLPYGWTAQDRIASLRRADRPACGMFPEDAGLFAASRQSRLPTEMEWRRAAYTRDTAWVEEMAAGSAREDTEYRYLLHRLHSRLFWAAAEASRAADLIYDAQTARGPKRIIPVTEEVVNVTNEIRHQLTAAPKNEWRWGQVGPVDALRQDISLFGVQNVLINAPELVQSRQNETLYAPKRFPAAEDPDLTLYRWRGTNWLEEAIAVDRNPALDDGSFVSLIRRGFRELMLIGVRRFGTWRHGMTFNTGSGQGSLVGEYTQRKQIYAGFRCAR